jgi:quercetin dioxygenase-like cupin family protein
MRFALHADDSADGRLFDGAQGCERFAQRLVRVGPGERRVALEPAADELLYVLAGRGTLTAGGEELPLRPASAAFVARGEASAIVAGEELELVSVLVPEPEAAGRAVAVVDLDAVERGSATAGREFLLGATPEVGCSSATQFVGLVPPGRAPDHFHRYDEVIYVLEGEGLLHVDGETAPLRPGSCVHLPRTLVHCLENSGDRELRLLGVFRPAGSPAEAYYPDGTPALTAEPA